MLILGAGRDPMIIRSVMTVTNEDLVLGKESLTKMVLKLDRGALIVWSSEVSILYFNTRSSYGLAAIIQYHSRQILRVPNSVFEVVFLGTQLASYGLTFVFASFYCLVWRAFKNELSAHFRLDLTPHIWLVCILVVTIGRPAMLQLDLTELLSFRCFKLAWFVTGWRWLLLSSYQRRPFVLLLFIRSLVLFPLHLLDLLLWLGSAGEIAFEFLHFNTLDRLAKDSCASFQGRRDWLEAVLRLLFCKELLCPLKSRNVSSFLPSLVLHAVLIWVLIKLVVLSRLWVIETCWGSLRTTNFLSLINLVSYSVCSDDPSATWRVACLTFWRDKFEFLPDFNCEAIDRDCLIRLFDEGVFRTDVICLRAFTIWIALLLLNVSLEFVNHDV